MVSDRTRRRIERLLDEADEAITSGDWALAQRRAADVLAFDPESQEAAELLAAAERRLSDGALPGAGESAAPANAPQVSAAVTETGGDAAIPTSFANGRYRVSKFLGEGGKKRVYQAHDTLLDREVAFALIKTEGFDQTSKERISREAQAMGRLGVHPNIVAVLDLGQEDDGSPYMVTELMGGGDVEGLLEDSASARSPLPLGEDSGEGTRVGSQSDPATSASDGPAGAYGPSPERPPGGSLSAPTRTSGLSLERTIEIGKAVCEGLEFAHARGIVHRDLKPGNVWLTEDGTAKIGDFGLAVMTDRSRLTREGMMVGTVSYMPPEQATGGEITPKADLYSLGAMLYEMVTGRPPFLGDDEIAIIGQHINTPPVAPTWHNGTCPRPLEALIMRLLAKDPAERPDSAQDVYNALDAIDLTARGQTVERDANSLESLAGGVFVGRQAEMDQLKAALEDVLGGRGRLVTLVGEPGIGKTRTSEELATYAGLRGAKVLWGRCYEGGGAPPYWPWVQAIRSYVRDIDPDELRRQMGSSASVVAEIVTDVKDRLPELLPPPQIDDPDSARFRLFDSITSFLRTASQSRPLVIVLDDLHWSDQSSLTFLEFIARELNQSRVLLLCTYRDMELNRRHPLTVTLGDLARDRLYERVLLRGLTETDIARFIEIAAGFDAPRELSATVQRHTEGNPLFVTEVIRDLVQSGELTEEKVAGRSTWSVRIPEGVREVIGRRLDRLSDRANEIFTTASVIGRDFTLDALRVLAEDTTEGQLLDVVDEGLDAKIIEELPDALGHYQFTHALVQETLTSELSLTRRVRLHARIAETLELMYGDRADEHATELAQHFGQAEEVLGSEKLVRYSLLAGERALATYAYKEALGHFQRALAAKDSGPTNVQTAEILFGLGRAQAATAQSHELQEAFDTMRRAFDYYAEAGLNSEAVAVAEYPIVSILGSAGVAGLLAEALELVARDSLEAGRLMSRYGYYLLYELGDYEAATKALDGALAIARREQDVPLEMATVAYSSVVDLWQSRWQSSLDKSLQAIELAPGVENPQAEVLARISGACSLLVMGEAQRVRELTPPLSLIERLARLWQGQALWYHESPYRLEGDWQAARDFSNQAREVGSLDALALATRVQLEYEVGEFSEGETYMKLLLEAMRAAEPGSGEYAFTALVTAKIARITGVTDRLELAESAGATVVSSPFAVPLWASLARMGLSLVAVLRDDVASAHENYGFFQTQRGTMYFDFSVDRLLGLLAQTIGESEDAMSHFEDALEFCRKAGYRPELAWTCSDYADMLLDRDPDGDRGKAIELQDEALTITQELGMRPLTERILARREILRA